MAQDYTVVIHTIIQLSEHQEECAVEIVEEPISLYLGHTEGNPDGNIQLASSLH